jgi:hypothetical protein
MPSGTVVYRASHATQLTPQSPNIRTANRTITSLTQWSGSRKSPSPDQGLDDSSSGFRVVAAASRMTRAGFPTATQSLGT